MKIFYSSVLICSFLVLSLLMLPALATYYEYDPDDPGEYAPMREGEKAVIPLDKKDPGYNVWQKTRDDLTKGREPGPITIQRFPGGPG